MPGLLMMRSMWMILNDVRVGRFGRLAKTVMVEGLFPKLRHASIDPVTMKAMKEIKSMRCLDENHWIPMHVVFLLYLTTRLEPCVLSSPIWHTQREGLDPTIRI